MRKKLLGNILLMVIVCFLLLLTWCTVGRASEIESVSKIFTFINNFYPKRIENLTSCQFQGDLWVFYQKYPFIPTDKMGVEEMDQTEIRTYYRVWEKKRWSEEKKFQDNVFQVVTDGKRLIALTAGGFMTFDGEKWSDKQSIEGWNSGFSCATPDGVWLFYLKDETDLVYRILQENTLSEEHIAVEEWDGEVGRSISLFGSSVPPAVYAYDRIWLFYHKKENEVGVFLKTFDGESFSDEEFINYALFYHPAVYQNKLYYFFNDWGIKGNGLPNFGDMHRVKCWVFDGEDWFETKPIQSRQPLAVSSATCDQSLWLFINNMNEVKYTKFENGKWSRLYGFSNSYSNWLKLSYTKWGLYFNLGAFLLMLLIVSILSPYFEKKKPVIMELEGGRYKAASLFRRFMAQSIDHFILFAVTMGLLNWVADLDSDLFMLFWFLAWLLSLIIVLAYYTVLESLFGKTLGKIVLRIKVISIDGSKCSFKSALIRNLFRILDGFAGYLVGTLVFAQSPKRQRIGDNVAKTVVVEVVEGVEDVKDKEVGMGKVIGEGM